MLVGILSTAENVAGTQHPEYSSVIDGRMAAIFDDLARMKDWHSI